MSNWVYLEVAISLALIYFLVSIVCTSLTEMIARWLALKARTLKDGILKLIDDPQLLLVILHHPLFKGLSPSGDDKMHEWHNWHIGGWYPFKKNHYGPSEIPSSTFSQIINDTLTDATGSSADLKQVSEDAIRNLGKLLNSGDAPITLKYDVPYIDKTTKKLTLLKKGTPIPLSENNRLILSSFLLEAKTKAANCSEAIKEFRKSVETWFDDSQKRVTGWYRRKTQLIVLVVALAICFAVNLDTLSIATALYNNPDLRQVVVTMAEETANKTATQAADLTYYQAQQKLASLNLPIGWVDVPITSKEINPKEVPTTKVPLGWPLKIVGILATAIAASLGSGFWYDIMKKLVGLKSGGKTSDASDDKKSCPLKTEEGK